MSFVVTGNATAVTDVYLRAEATTLTMPDGRVVPMWGFAKDTAFEALDGAVTVPGPVLKLPPGETVLRIHLDNNLPEPTSIHINGLILANNTGPVFSNLGSGAVAFTGNRPGGNTTARVRSFGHETAPGNTVAVIYEFNLRPGTYLYGSGTNPAKQVQMGLYGALTVDTPAGAAYTGVPYTEELVMVYSEVDPMMNDAIAAGDYGPAGLVKSSVHRDSKYYLINGKAYNPALPGGGGLDPIAVFTPGAQVLVRSINAGYEIHVPQFLNAYVNLVAEDGSPLTYSKERYGFQLPAGKTVDAVLTPAVEGRYSIHDAALHMTNNGAPAPGGMLAYYQVSLAPACPGDINGDGIVEFADLSIMRASFFTACTVGVPCPADLNGDGIVEFADLAILRANFFNTCPAP